MVRSLSAEEAELGGLLEVLRDEQQSLLERDFRKVAALTPAKEKRLAALGALGNMRGRTLRQMGLAVDGGGMNTLLAASAVLKQAWMRVHQLAQEARHLNQVNGSLIGAQMRFVEGALGALQRNGVRFTTYGADGQKRGALARHSLASA